MHEKFSFQRYGSKQTLSAEGSQALGYRSNGHNNKKIFMDMRKIFNDHMTPLLQKKCSDMTMEDYYY